MDFKRNGLFEACGISSHVNGKLTNQSTASSKKPSGNLMTMIVWATM